MLKEAVCNERWTWYKVDFHCEWNMLYPSYWKELCCTFMQNFPNAHWNQLWTMVSGSVWHYLPKTQEKENLTADKSAAKQLSLSPDPRANMVWVVPMASDMERRDGTSTLGSSDEQHPFAQALNRHCLWHQLGSGLGFVSTICHRIW